MRDGHDDFRFKKLTAGLDGLQSQQDKTLIHNEHLLKQTQSPAFRTFIFRPSTDSTTTFSPSEMVLSLSAIQTSP